MKNFLKLSCAVAIVASASAAAAQSGSDVTGPPPGSTVTFAPLPVPSSPSSGGRGGSSPTGTTAGNPAAALPAILNAGNALNSGPPPVNPLSNQPVPPAAAQAVGSIITGGAGSQGAQQAMNTALQGAGLPGPGAAALVTALAALGGANANTAPGLVLAAANAFNALLNTPQGLAMIAGGNLPPQLVAARAALNAMLAAMR